jgi:hypothetical protein
LQEDLAQTSLSAMKSKNGPLFRCMVCPNAFHVDCLPPLANFHELAVLCHEHAATHKLPEMSSEMSVLKDKNVKEKVKETWRLGGGKGSGEVVRVVDSKTHVDGFSLPDMVLPAGSAAVYGGASFDSFNKKDLDELAFKLPLDLHDEVFSKPPAYSHINGLKYVRRTRAKRAQEKGVVRGPAHVRNG